MRAETLGPGTRPGAVPGRRSRGAAAAFVLSCLGLALLSPPPARAWGHAGHAQVAQVAWTQLDRDTRLAIARALERHPRFQQDFASRMPQSIASATAADGERARWIFLQASIWPDLMRQFKDADDAALRGLHRSRWHYVNQPLRLDRVGDADPGPAPPFGLERCRAAERLNIVQALELSVCKLGDPGLRADERAAYLSWLIHLVGDAHQPLHAVSLYSDGLLSEGDRGGNSIRPAGVASLHAAWDGLPGRAGRRDRIGAGPAAAAVERLLADTAQFAAGQRAAGVRDFAAWVRESRELALRHAYTDEVLAAVRRAEGPGPGQRVVDIPALSDAYLARAAEVTQRRIVEAGFRLASVLQRLPR